jgi:solute carrier family 44 protein 1 (choline transporter-like protein)
MPNISSLNFTSVCLKSCPTNANTNVDCLGSICASGPIPALYKSINVGDIICIPDPTDISVVQAVNANILTRVFADIKVCWSIFLGALGASFILGFLYFWFMRACAGVVVWLSILTWILGTLAVGVYMFMYTKGVKLIEIPFSLTQYSRESLEYTSYAMWFVSFLSLLIVVCAWSRIRLAIAVVKSTSMYLAQTCQVIFFPPCMALVMIVVLGLILAGFFFIYSVGDMYQLPII